MGYPLWYPESGVWGQPYVGDVGLLHEGSFVRLFNVLRPADAPENAGGVPEGFEPFALNEVYRSTRCESSSFVSPGVRLSQGPKARTAGPAVDTYVSFALYRKAELDPDARDSLVSVSNNHIGAMLMVAEPPTSERILDHRDLRAYMLANFDAWVAHALHVGFDRPEPVLVTGTTTARAPWVAAVFYGDRASMSVDAASCSVQTSKESAGAKYRRGEPDASAGGGHCLFLRYYKMRVRLFLPRTIVAAAEPQDEGHDDGHSKSNQAGHSNVHRNRLVCGIIPSSSLEPNCFVLADPLSEHPSSCTTATQCLISTVCKLHTSATSARIRSRLITPRARLPDLESSISNRQPSSRVITDRYKEREMRVYTIKLAGLVIP